MNIKEKVYKICKTLEERNVKITVDEVVSHSLFLAGGTLAGYDKETSFYIDTYQAEKLISIGFCQPKYYKPSTWQKAKKVMNELCSFNIGVKPFDYGRGKGKYTYDGKLSISELADTYVKFKAIRNL